MTILTVKYIWYVEEKQAEHFTRMSWHILRIQERTYDLYEKKNNINGKQEV